MRATKILATYAVVMGVAVSAAPNADAEDGCTSTLYVINGFENNIRTTKGELGNLKHWTTAWNGEDVIEPSKSVRKIVHTGQSCTDSEGNPRRWTARITRKNGKQHICSGISTNSKATLKPGGGCDVTRQSGT